MNWVENWALFGSQWEWGCTSISDVRIVCLSVGAPLLSIEKHQALKRERGLFCLLEPLLYEVYLFGKVSLVCSEELCLLRLGLLVVCSIGTTLGLLSFLDTC